jgi:signal transduction histidine kinase
MVVETRREPQPITQHLAAATHELRTPLHAILASAELLLEGIPDPLSPGAQHHVARIRRSAQHLAQLVDALLTFTRLEAGAEASRSCEYDLGEMLEHVNAVASPLCESKDLEYIPAVCSAGLVLRGDERKLRQVLINLVGNAIRYTNTGQVAFSALHTEPGTWFQIADTGIGMTAEELDRIYDPFWRSTRAEEGGTGLGMSIVRAFVDLLGGQLEITSRINEGTVVRLFIPDAPQGS